MHIAVFACALAISRAGSNSAMSSATMGMTPSNSIRANAAGRLIKSNRKHLETQLPQRTPIERWRGCLDACHIARDTVLLAWHEADDPEETSQIRWARF